MKSFTVQPFGQRIGVTADPHELVGWWNRYAPNSAKMDMAEIHDCLGMAVHQERRPKGCIFVIYMAEDATVSTVFHESLHMAHYIMEYSSAPISLDSTETQAYLMEHIAEKVMEKLK